MDSWKQGTPRVAGGGMFRKIRPSLLGVLVASLVAASALLVPAKSVSAAACPTYKFIGVHGTGEGSSRPGASERTVMGETVWQTWRGFQSAANAHHVTLAHWADPYPRFGLPELIRTAATEGSVINDGAQRIVTETAPDFVNCPSEKLILVGYSAGAWVIDRYLQYIGPGLAPRVAAVVLYGDPQFPTPPGGVAYNSPLRITPYVPNLSSNQFMSLCLSYRQGNRMAWDPVCAGGTAGTAHPRDTLNCLQNNNLCVHFHYVDNAVTRGVNYIVSRTL